MDYSEKWVKLEKIGNGGQGEVFHTVNKKYKQDIDTTDPLYKPKGKDLESISNTSFYTLYTIIDRAIKYESEKDKFAIKILYKPMDDPNFQKAKIRLRDEIEAMHKKLHTNLVCIEDHDSEYLWYVMKYYSKGILSNHLHKYKGKLLKTLYAFRPLVEAVAELHKNKYVHRDIKPQNIFIDDDGQLILGDFGLVYYLDREHSRISNTYEKVGSSDWMPSWARVMKIEDIKPTFDVFCLGKVLWAMISGKTLLPLWYFEQEEYNVESLFPSLPSVTLLNTFFNKCIVEKENDCLFKNASDMLNYLDQLIAGVMVGAERIGTKTRRICKVCGIGKYSLAVYDDTTKIHNYGFSPAGSNSYRLMFCGHCGHIQLFLFDVYKKDAFRAWLNDTD
jgi:serine/threonine protein kinase